LSPRNSSRDLLTLGLFAVLSLTLAVGAGGCGSGSASAAKEKATTPKKAEKAVVKPSSAATGKKAEAGDRSIQGYGAEAAVSERGRILGAMHSFLLAMASRNYPGVCADLAASDREQLARLQPGAGCAATSADLVDPGIVAAAKSALAATIKKVRIGGGDAFVLLRPAGGTLNYIVLKHEGASWKAISLAPGTPLNADAAP
jgi:hypothetical protein